MLNFKCDLYSPIFVAACVIRDLGRELQRNRVPYNIGRDIIRNRLHQLSDREFNQARTELRDFYRLNRPQRITGRKL